MEYIIVITSGNERKILGKYKSIDEANIAGKLAYENSCRGDVVSCIVGVINPDGKIEGKYKLIKSWF